LARELKCGHIPEYNCGTEGLSRGADGW